MDKYRKEAEVGGGELPSVPDGTHDAIIQEVTEPREIPDIFSPGKTKINFVVKWKLTSNLPEGTVLWQHVTLPGAYLNDGYLSEKSKLYDLMEGLGFDLSGRFRVDPPSWHGMEARVMVKNFPNVDGEPRPRITAVKPKRQQRRQPLGSSPSRGRARAADAEAPWD